MDAANSSALLAVDGDFARNLLISGFPQDDDVAEVIAKELKKEHSRAADTSWAAMATNFRDHPKVVDAVDRWFSQKPFYEPFIAQAALVGRTEIAKAVLIKNLDSTVPFWAAKSLLEGWGMRDPQVAEQLQRLASAPGSRSSRIGHLLPLIIDDQDRCQQRLMVILHDPSSDRLGLVLSGLHDLGTPNPTAEVVDEVLMRLRSSDRFWDDGIVARLISYHSGDPRVRELALEQFGRRQGEAAAAAFAYPRDGEIRKHVIALTYALPARLRNLIATALTEEGTEPHTATDVLKGFYQEVHPAVRTQASIGYHQYLRVSGRVTPAVELLLKQEITSYGPEYYERRQAALCGILEIRRLDMIVGASETSGKEERPLSVPIETYASVNPALIRHLLSNWSTLRSAFGNELWTFLGKGAEANEMEIWNQFAEFADDHSEPMADLLSFVENNQDKALGAQLLRFVGRVRPQSALLRQLCIRSIASAEDTQGLRTGARDAAELLGRHFRGNTDVFFELAALGAKRRPEIHEPIALALCEGWPTSELLAEFYGYCRENKIRLSYPLFYQLHCRLGKPEEIEDLLAHELLSETTTSAWHLGIHSALVRPLVRRLGSDTVLRKSLNEKLKRAQTPSAKASLPGLLAAGEGLSSTLRTWCVEEIKRQLDPSLVPEIGYDILQGRRRTVVHSLLDLVAGVA